MLHENIDIESLVSLIMGYATPIVGAALILGGIFLRLLGKGISYLILGAGIVSTGYVAFVPNTFKPDWLQIGQSDQVVYGVFLAGIGASVALALAFRALTAAIEFGFFNVGWYLLLPAVLAFAQVRLSSVPGASAWMGSAILTTALAEWLMKRPLITRRLPVPSVAAKASTILGARR